MKRIDILDDFAKGIMHTTSPDTEDKTEYAILCGPYGLSREKTAILFSKAFAEMIEIPEIQAIFRKYGIQFIYKVPIAEKANEHR